jgi:hypothetical protein
MPMMQNPRFTTSKSFVTWQIIGVIVFSIGYAIALGYSNIFSKYIIVPIFLVPTAIAMVFTKGALQRIAMAAGLVILCAVCFSVASAYMGFF